MTYLNPGQMVNAIARYKSRVQRLMQDKDFFEIANKATRLVMILGEHKISDEELREKASSSDIAKLVLDLRSMGAGWHNGYFDQIRMSYEMSIISCDDVVRELSRQT